MTIASLRSTIRRSVPAALFLSMFAAVLPLPAAAQTALLPACALGAGGCGICDLVALLGSVSVFLLDVVSVVVVLSIIIGGLYWILSFGNAERVDRGKQIITAAFIGLGFVLAGFTIVNLVLATLTDESPGEIIRPFSQQEWSEFCKDQLVAPPEEKLLGCDTNDGDNEGKACSADGCTDENVCVCWGTKCVPRCAQQVAGETLFTATGMCEIDADFCSQYSPGPAGAETGIVRDDVTRYACPTNMPTCCVIGGDPRRRDASVEGGLYLEWKGN